MTEIFKTLAALRKKYPEDDDLLRIDKETIRVKKLLKLKEYSDNDVTRELVILCRSEILAARKRLSTDKSLLGDEKAQRELWFLIESRIWFLDMVCKNIDDEIDTLNQELESELAK